MLHAKFFGTYPIFMSLNLSLYQFALVKFSLDVFEVQNDTIIKCFIFYSFCHFKTSVKRDLNTVLVPKALKFMRSFSYSV